MGTSPQQSCGCKGVRFCALCETTERVKKLRVDGDKYENYKVFLFDHKYTLAHPAPSLNSKSSLEEIVRESNSCTPSGSSIKIDGLLLIHDFLSENEENSIMKMIDNVEWVQSQSGRRKQDYGPKVNFKHKKVKTDSFIGMPEYADMLLTKMKNFNEEKLGNYQPFEMCNLEYESEKKSAIEMHQDDTWIWGNRLISINLLSGSVMTLANDTKKHLCYVHMPHRSLICMADEARYEWTHGVLAHHIRGRRIALTMREPAKEFKEGGELYEKYGAELIRLGNIRVPLNHKTSAC
ncbi:unnamed protein product [Caenorhabditis bovis]|uniref:Alpha-ketoglutarate-dependent dioxygenase AlkB-like domain-containing protein n=1 Tax=Caenorhabditis bovis TaxID=2654633 RepID=A0A8S1EMU4_9PELO|nr:unnamed protein product [Caenorhabditis bovis]